MLNGKHIFSCCYYKIEGHYHWICLTIYIYCQQSPPSGEAVLTLGVNRVFVVVSHLISTFATQQHVVLNFATLTCSLLLLCLALLYAYASACFPPR